MSIQPTRTQFLNDADIRKGDYVLYWMQQSQRAEFNPALECAIARARRVTDGRPDDCNATRGQVDPECHHVPLWRMDERTAAQVQFGNLLQLAIEFTSPIRRDDTWSHICMKT